MNSRPEDSIGEFAKLPREIVEKIIDLLPWRDVVSLLRTNNFFRNNLNISSRPEFIRLNFWRANFITTNFENIIGMITALARTKKTLVFASNGFVNTYSIAKASGHGDMKLKMGLGLTE